MGMLLGFVVSERGIEANLEKISAIMDMGSIKNLKGVQCVTGCLTQEYPQESSDIDRSDYIRASAPVYLSDNPSGQHSFGG
jgi:hypothetical protein